MKNTLLVLMVMLSTQTHAYEEVWKLGDHFLAMEKNEAKKILISKSCVSKSCEALQALKKVSLKSISSAKFSGGKNPGAVACTESVQGKIVYLKDLNGNENTFCVFPDKSLVSTSSLAVFAEKNDKGKK